MKQLKRNDNQTWNEIAQLTPKLDPVSGMKWAIFFSIQSFIKVLSFLQSKYKEKTHKTLVSHMTQAHAL